MPFVLYSIHITFTVHRIVINIKPLASAGFYRFIIVFKIFNTDNYTLQTFILAYNLQMFLEFRKLQPRYSYIERNVFAETTTISNG